jgi:hypothetical protein
MSINGKRLRRFIRHIRRIRLQKFFAIKAKIALLMDFSGFSDKLKTATLRAAPTDRLRPTDQNKTALSVGLNLSVGEKTFRVLF